MKIIREDLLKKLESITPGLTEKEVLEQSSCFVFKNGRIATFNDEVACSIDFESEIEGAIKAKPLLELLRRLTESELTVTFEDKQLRIRGERRKAGIHAEEEVTLPVDSVDMPTKWRTLHNEFSEAVGIVGQCCSKDQSRFVLTCVHIHPEWLEATDNSQITRYPMKTGIKESRLIRWSAIKSIAGADVTEFGETENWLHFRNPDGLVISCRRYLDQFPSETSKVLNVTGDEITLPEGLSDAVARASIFSKNSAEKEEQVEIHLKPGAMRLEGRGFEGWYVESKKIIYNGAEVKFSTTPKLLVELVKRSNQCILGDRKLKVQTEKFVYVACTIVGKDKEKEGEG